MAMKKSKIISAEKSVFKKLGRRKFRASSITKIVIILLCTGLSYILWLDYRIHEEFEGSKWTVPARVYSKPYDLYTGQALSIIDLLQALQTNNYQQVSEISGPGHYYHQNNRIDVYLREFDYWDEHVGANPYRIVFEDNVIRQIIDLGSQMSSAIIRLEPVLIGKIYPDHNEDRILVTMAEVPDFLVNALISVEDRSFFSHFGVDIKGILRAFWVNLRERKLSQGGSTLTQQLVKNYFLTQQQTLTRKLNELIMSLLLERRYEKTEILSAYLNEVYLGQNGARAIHGFGTSAEFYFNMPLDELRRDQLALLVGLVQGASFYNPRRSPDRAIVRRNLVLRLMFDQGHIDHDIFSTMQNRPLDVAIKPGGSQSGYHTFLDLAKRQLLVDYKLEDLKNEGLRIYTTLDTMVQDKLNSAVSGRLSNLEQQRNLQQTSLQSASVLINPANGEVLAINGGRNNAISGFNRALDAKRPIGSLIKPFIYLTALSNPRQFSLSSILQDKKISLTQEDGTPWTPDNYDQEEHGNISLLEAMINSYNLATVRLGMEIGLENIISTLKLSGITSTIPAYPSLLLGAIELSPFEVTQMYQTLANGGYQVPLNSIREVLDRNGQPLQRRSLNVSKALNEEEVFLINYMLTKVVEFGTARQLPKLYGEDIRLAGKTGTTNESRDSWFAGFGDNILAVSWLGRDDNQPTPFTGASGAMRIWVDIMQSVSLNPLNLISPPNISWTERTFHAN